MPQRQAARQVEDRITKGENLLRRKVETDDHFGRLEQDYKIWSDYNRTFLQSIFSTDELSRDYHAATMSGVVPGAVELG